jgi:hypothetical protein
MAEYQLTNVPSILRVADGAFIPMDELNADYVEYQRWLEAGGVPDPYVPEQVQDTLKD